MKRKIVLTSVFLILLTLISSCDLTPMEEGRSVNEYIFPYVKFELTEDEDGNNCYSATVLSSAHVSSVYIPSYIEDNENSSLPIRYFNGFEVDSDAKNLREITFESSSTTFSSDVLMSIVTASESETVLFTIDNIDSDYKTYSDLAVIEKPGKEFVGWFIKGTEVVREKDDAIIERAQTLEARWKDHDLEYKERIEATCTADGNIAYYKCLSCKKCFLDKAALEEISDSEIIIPASHKLEHIDAVSPTCTEAGNIEHYKCKVCSRLFTDTNAEHEIESAEIAPLKHTLFPNDGKAATCTENGIKKHYECENCHSLFLDEDGKNATSSAELVIPATGHEFVRKQYSETASCTWEECIKCGETQNAAGHTWNEGVVTKAPTTTEHGTKLFTCTVCGKEEDEDIPPLGDHTWVDVKNIDATCTERGYTIKRCTSCSIEYKDNYIDAVGHRTEYFEAKDATCLENGNNAYYKCSVCLSLFKDRNGINKTTEDEITRKARGYHDWGTTWLSDDTYHWHKCRYCEAVTDGVKHEYKEKVVVVDYILSSATCTESAVYYYSCECGRKGSGTFVTGEPLGHLDKTEHPKVESTCEEQGHEAYWTCSRSCCSGRYYLDKDYKKYTTNYNELVLPYAHVFEKNQYSTDADGKYHYRVCDKCGQSVESTRGEHTFTWAHTDYEHWQECTVCGYQKGKEDHILTGDLGKRKCEKCGFSEEKSEDSKKGGFEVIEINKKPNGYLTAEKDSTEWTFTLVSTNDENAKPDKYIWSLDGEEVECDGDVYVLSAPEKRSYRVMCVFTANGYFASNTKVITGGE